MLVVDDESLVREVIAAMLEDLGCVVLQAADAREALAMLAADQRITILITDVNIPGMGGYKLAREATRSGCDLQ